MIDLLAGTDNLWTIHAIGSPNFMHKVFTAIALLGEGGVLMRMGQIGFLVGLFVLCYRIATAAGSLVDVRQAMLAGVIFAAMFGTSTTVKLVGMVATPGSGGGADVRIVDNVPWGIAAIGAVISGTGVYLTRRMETAFRDPNAIPVTQGGFGRTAEILASVRQLSLDSVPNALPVYDAYKRSMLAYLRDCVMRARQFEVLSDHTIVSAPDPLSAIRWNNGLQDTRSWLVTLGGDSESVSCPIAHQLLTDKTGDMLAGLDPAYQHRFGGNTSESIGRALASVANRGAADAQTYVSGAMINALWLEAASGSSFGSMGNNNTLMIRSAIEQRRTQWVAEETAFLKAMRPMIGYFESFFYALSPFVAFLVGLGAMGLRMIVKYVSLTLAVALWMPVLAITNLYQITTLQDFFATQEQMANAGDSGIFSLSNNAAVLDQATEAMALASMIAAATPMLTLTLLFGGAVAATSLFSRLQGQDHLNERMVAPEPVAPAAAYAAAPGFQGNDALGLRHSGDEANAIRFDLGAQMQQSVRSLQADSRAAQTKAEQTWGRVFANNKQFEQVFSTALEHQLTDSSALAHNKGTAALERLGFDADERIQAIQTYVQSTGMDARGEVNAGVSVGRVLGFAASLFDSVARSVATSDGPADSGQAIATDPGKVSAASNADVRNTTSNSEVKGSSSKSSRMGDLGAEVRVGAGVSEQGQDSSAMGKGLVDSHHLSQEERKGVAQMLHHAVSEAMGASTQQAGKVGISEQVVSQLNESRNDMLQSQQAFEEAEQAAESFGVGQTMSLLTASTRIASLPEAERREIESSARVLGGDEAYRMNLAAIQSRALPGVPVDPEGQRAAASLLTLAGIGPGAAATEHTPGLAELTDERRQELVHALGLGSGIGGKVMQSDPMSGMSLRTGAPTFGSTLEVVEKGIDKSLIPSGTAVDGAISSVRDTVNAEREAMARQASHMDASYESAAAELRDQASSNMRQVRSEAGASVVDRMRDMSNDDAHMIAKMQQHLSAFDVTKRLIDDQVRGTLGVEPEFRDTLESYRREAEGQNIHGDYALAYAAAKFTVEHPLDVNAGIAAGYAKEFFADQVSDGDLPEAHGQAMIAKLLLTGELQQADYAALSVASGGMHAPEASVDQVIAWRPARGAQ